MDDDGVLRRVTARLLEMLDARPAWREHAAGSAVARRAFERARLVARGELSGEAAERAFNALATVAGERGPDLWGRDGEGPGADAAP